MADKVDFKPLVATFYREYLGREGEPEGLKAHSDAMNAGRTEAQVREDFIRSPEFARRFPGEAQPPEPLPIPVPGGPMLLSVRGNQFVDSKGAVVKLLGVGGVCCTETALDGSNPAKVCGWPMVSLEQLRIYAENLLNFVHIRLGPFIAEDKGSDFNAYAAVDDVRYDLNRWNPAFWAKVRAICTLAQQLGIYVEVDVIDGWMLRNGPHLNPWNPAFNVQGESHMGCEVLRHAPPPRLQQWVAEVVRQTGAFECVLYQLGNENFACDATLDYEGGVAAIIREAENEHGFPRHLIGQNSEGPETTQFDYIERHVNEAQPLGLQPIMVNEYVGDTGSLSPDLFRAEAAAAFRWGTSFHLWMGQQTPEEWLVSLGHIKAIREGQVTVPAKCPPVTKWGVKIHGIQVGNAYISFNPTNAHGPVGCNVVLDSTPFFGSGGPCNQEKPGICGGRKCEPAGGPDWRQLAGPRVETRLDSDGYMLHVVNCPAGDYVFETQMKPGATDQEVPPLPLEGGGPGTARQVKWSVP